MSGWAGEANAPKTGGGEDAGGVVVEGNCGTEVEAGGPDISDTRLIGTLVLPDVERRLYECEFGGRGLRVRGRRHGSAMAAARRGRLGQGTGFLPAPFRKPETKIVST